MNVLLPGKPKYSLKEIIIYIGAILVCLVIGITIAVTKQIEKKELEQFIDSSLVEKVNYLEKTTKQIQILESQFKNKFSSTVDKKTDEISFEKIEEEKDIVYEKMSITQEKENVYNIKCSIPQLNINSNNAIEVNKQIEELLKEPILNILDNTNINTSYQTQYVASQRENIISLMIKMYIKQDQEPQKIIIKTYNYDIKKDKLISFQEYIEEQKINSKKLQKNINSIIKDSYNKTEALNNLNYNVFQRNLDDPMYLVENVDTFYLCENTLYVIFSYGKDNNTSEMDVVII